MTRPRLTNNVGRNSARYDYSARGVVPGQVWKSRRSDRTVTVVFTGHRRVWYEEETAAGTVRKEVTAWHLVQRYRLTGTRLLSPGWRPAVTAGDKGQPLGHEEGTALSHLYTLEESWPESLVLTAPHGVLRLAREDDQDDVIATFNGIWFRGTPAQGEDGK